MKTWLITGCSKGLGKALSEAVLADGNRLAATARNSDDLTDLRDRYGDLVRLSDLDVTKSDERGRRNQSGTHSLAGWVSS
ncbi:MAG: SDR family NAD(P)-dependent oxidoreductase, partial [Hyphomicrobiales bacterium]|nr:SDR family NAD(P)-dependent oxidoreductase [Hyphomicrobiales bacterium]